MLHPGGPLATIAGGNFQDWFSLSSAQQVTTGSKLLISHHMQFSAACHFRPSRFAILVMDGEKSSGP